MRWLAADLPVAVWSLVLGQVLQQAGTGQYDEPFGPASAVLASALQLASVSTLWREAAVHTSRLLPDLELRTYRDLNPLFLSPLLAAWRSMYMRCPLYATPAVPAFLELSGLVELTLDGWWTPSEAEAGWLGGCTTLRRLSVLNCSPGFTGEAKVPSAFPVSLHALTVGFAGSPVRNSAAALLQRLQGLPALTELGLAFTDFQLPAHIPHFASLRRLTVNFDVWPGARAVSLPALHKALPGVKLVLEVHLSAIGRGQECEEYSNPCSADRARVWAAIAKVPALGELHLSAHTSYGVHEPALPVELGLLGRVACKELVLHSDMLLTPFAAHLLCMVDCGTVLCRQRFEGPDSAPLQWSSLAAGSGIFVFELDESASLAIAWAARLT